MMVYLDRNIYKDFLQFKQFIRSVKFITSPKGNILFSFTYISALNAPLFRLANSLTTENKPYLFYCQETQLLNYKLWANGLRAVCGFHYGKIIIMVFLLYRTVFYVVCCISEVLPASIFGLVQNLNIISVTRDYFVFLFTAVFPSFSGTLNPFQVLNYPASPLTL